MIRNTTIITFLSISEQLWEITHLNIRKTMYKDYTLAYKTQPMLYIKPLESLLYVFTLSMQSIQTQCPMRYMYMHATKVYH